MSEKAPTTAHTSTSSEASAPAPRTREHRRVSTPAGSPEEIGAYLEAHYGKPKVEKIESTDEIIARLEESLKSDPNAAQSKAKLETIASQIDDTPLNEEVVVATIDENVPVDPFKSIMDRFNERTAHIGVRSHIEPTTPAVEPAKVASPKVTAKPTPPKSAVAAPKIADPKADAPVKKTEAVAPKVETKETEQKPVSPIVSAIRRVAASVNNFADNFEAKTTSKPVQPQAAEAAPVTTTTDLKETDISKEQLIRKRAANVRRLEMRDTIQDYSNDAVEKYDEIRDKAVNFVKKLGNGGLYAAGATLLGFDVAKEKVKSSAEIGSKKAKETLEKARNLEATEKAKQAVARAKKLGNTGLANARFTAVRARSALDAAREAWKDTGEQAKLDKAA